MMMKIKCINKQFKRGDSIIEVLLAVAIFSAIAVSSIAIMNKGLSSAQTSLESTIVRTELDSQAEMIRFIEQSYEKNASGVAYIENKGEVNEKTYTYEDLWQTMVGLAVSPKNDAGSDYAKLKDAIDGSMACPTTSSSIGAFVFSNSIGDLALKTTTDGGLSFVTSSIPSSEGGLWVAVVKNKDTDYVEEVDYYDFYISACWDALGSNIPAKRTTIIRLRNPDSNIASGVPLKTYAGSLKAKFCNGYGEATEWLYENEVSTGRPAGNALCVEITALEVTWTEGTDPPSSQVTDAAVYNNYKAAYKDDTRTFYEWRRDSSSGNPENGYTCIVNPAIDQGECDWSDGNEPKYIARWAYKAPTVLAHEKIFSILMSFPCAKSRLTLVEGYGCADLESNQRNYKLQLIDSSGTNIVSRPEKYSYKVCYDVGATNSCIEYSSEAVQLAALLACYIDFSRTNCNTQNDAIGFEEDEYNTFESYEEFSDTSDKAAFYREPETLLGEYLNYELGVIRARSNHTDTTEEGVSRREELLVNIAALDAGEYTLKIHAFGDNTKNTGGDYVSLINNIKIETKSYENLDSGGTRPVGEPGSTIYTSGITESNGEKDYVVFNIIKKTDGSFLIVEP